MKKKEINTVVICKNCNRELKPNDWIGVCSISRAIGCRWCMRNEKGRIYIKGWGIEDDKIEILPSNPNDVREGVKYMVSTGDKLDDDQWDNPLEHLDDPEVLALSTLTESVLEKL